MVTTTHCVSRKPGRQPGARFALIVFFLIALVDYADRTILSSVKDPIKHDFGLTDTQTSYPWVFLNITYLVFAPIWGWLTDMEGSNRKLLLMVGTVFWSLATAGAGLAENLSQLVIFRSLVGLGSGVYLVVVPVVIADYYPKIDRIAAYCVSAVAMPLGGAIGFAVGAVVAPTSGWRSACYVCGFPGCAVAVLVWFCNFPPRGCNACPVELAKRPSGSLLTDFWSLWTNGHFMLSTCSAAANNFVIGALLEWGSPFMSRYTSISTSHANMYMSALAFVGGISGSLVGTKTVHYVEPYLTNNSTLIVPAVFQAFTAGITLLGVLLIGSGAFVAASPFLLLGFIGNFACIPPINLIGVTSVPESLRGRAQGFKLIFTTLLGSMLAPPAIGFVSDYSGSLASGMHLSWFAGIVATLFLVAELVFLSPLDPELANDDTEADKGNASAEGQGSILSLFWTTSAETPMEKDTPGNYGTASS